MIFWTAGIKAPPLADKIAAATGAKQDKIGRIQVTPTLTVPDHPEISVIGDLMSHDNLPGVAEVARALARVAGGEGCAARIGSNRCRAPPGKPPN